MIHIYWKDQSWCDPNVALVIFWVGICPTKTTMSHSLGWVSWLEWPPTNELFGSFSFRRAVHGDVNFMKKYGQQNCKLRCFYLFFLFLFDQPTWKILYSQIGNLPQIGVKIKDDWNHQLVLFFFCPSGNIGLPQLIGVLRDFFARIGISKLRLLEPKFEDWKNLHENSWNPKQHRYLTPKRKIKHEILRCCTCCTCCKWLILGGGFKDFIFSSLFGEMIQFDWYFSDGLKPPTSGCLVISNHFPYNDLESFNWKF